MGAFWSFFSFFLFDPRDYNQKLSCFFFFFPLKHSNFNIKSCLRIDKACDSKWKREITNTDSVQGKKESFSSLKEIMF